MRRDICATKGTTLIDGTCKFNLSMDEVPSNYWMKLIRLVNRCSNESLTDMFINSIFFVDSNEVSKISICSSNTNLFINN